jgi:hypothetical protein
MKRLSTLLLLLTFVGMTSTVAARPRSPMPPHSNAYGRSLTEWMKLYATWLAGGAQADHVGNVRFLPLPVSEVASGSGTYSDPFVLVGQQDVTLQPGTAFTMPLVAWVGETYDPALGIPDDVPFDRSIFTDPDLLVTLDGQTLIDSDVDDLTNYYFGPVHFDATIPYAQPTPYGAIGAIWVQGLGFVHHPLPVGTHTLTVHSELLIPAIDLGYVFENQWTITVRPGK